MPDFWQTSGFPLARRNEAGWLVATDALLRAWMVRPELEPESDDERAFQQRLLDQPRGAADPAALADPDARGNWQAMLRFRDHLLAHDTIEAAYLALFRAGPVALPPLLIDQMVHLIARNMLEGCDDPLRLRAAELLFRRQKATVQDGGILLADEEVVEMHAAGQGFGALGRLVAEAQTPLRTVELDVLTRENAAMYWARSERFDTVLDLSFSRPGLDALCRTLEAWLRHFLGLQSRIHPVQSVRDERWVWHIGLDGEASALLNDLYEGREPGEERLRRLLSLFRLELRDDAAMLPRVAGRPIYLGLAMDAGGFVRLKPQNLLVNLPLRAAA